MPRACTICLHPRRDEIDLRINAGASIPSIASEFEFAASSGYRHRQKCISAKKVTGSTHAGTVSQMEFLRARDIELAELQEKATTRGHSAAACQIVRERRQIGEAIEKLRIAGDAEVSVKATGTLTIALLDAIVNGDFDDES
jgi:hypothetical protein